MIFFIWQNLTNVFGRVANVVFVMMLRYTIVKFLLKQEIMNFKNRSKQKYIHKLYES